MFRNHTTCPICSQSIDYFDSNCPYCHSENTEFKKLRISKNTINVAWYFQLIMFLIGWMGIQFIAVIVEIIISILTGVPLTELTEHMNELAIAEFITYGIEFILMIIMLIISGGYKKIYKPFLNYKSYLFGLAGLGALFLASTYYDTFKSVFDNSVSDNQYLITGIVLNQPVPSIIFFCLIGPICEELTYRVGLFGLLRRWNRVAAYLIGIFVFAAVHFNVNVILYLLNDNNIQPLISELWNFPSYLIGGAVLVTIYDLFGFGASSITHILNNLIGIIGILITAKYGS